MKTLQVGYCSWLVVSDRDLYQGTKLEHSGVSLVKYWVVNYMCVKLCRCEFSESPFKCCVQLIDTQVCRCRMSLIVHLQVMRWHRHDVWTCCGVCECADCVLCVVCGPVLCSRIADSSGSFIHIRVWYVRSVYRSVCVSKNLEINNASQFCLCTLALKAVQCTAICST